MKVKPPVLSRKGRKATKSMIISHLKRYSGFRLRLYHLKKYSKMKMQLMVCVGVFGEYRVSGRSRPSGAMRARDSKKEVDGAGTARLRGDSRPHLH